MIKIINRMSYSLMNQKKVTDKTKHKISCNYENFNIELIDYNFICDTCKVPMNIHINIDDFIWNRWELKNRTYTSFIQWLPKELMEMGFDDALVKRVLRMVNINEFKREQAAPVLRISAIDAPAIYSMPLEKIQLPYPQQVVDKVLEIC